MEVEIPPFYVALEEFIKDEIGCFANASQDSLLIDDTFTDEQLVKIAKRILGLKYDDFLKQTNPIKRMNIEPDLRKENAMGDLKIQLDIYSGDLVGNVLNYSPEIPNSEYQKLKEFIIQELAHNANVRDNLMWGLKTNYLLRRDVTEEEYHQRRTRIMRAALDEHGAAY